MVISSINHIRRISQHDDYFNIGRQSIHLNSARCALMIQVNWGEFTFSLVLGSILEHAFIPVRSIFPYTDWWHNKFVKKKIIEAKIFQFFDLGKIDLRML